MDDQKLALTPYGAVPNARQMEWYRRGKTAFLHFTVNTFTDREWGDGTESPEVFAPTALDCRQWVKVLKGAGFTAAILTAKHHDGFCLWPTETTEHSVKNSPLGVDVVKLFTDACREEGMKAGLYLSPWDRNCPQWGTDAYNDFYAAQLTELMTRYGTIWECWWDGAGSDKAHYDWKRWADIVREKQPQCVIFGCLGAAEYADVRWVGTEDGVSGSPCYGTIELAPIHHSDLTGLNHGAWGASHFIPAENDTSIRPGWFYHAEQDEHVRTPENLVEYWFRSAGRNSGILLNLPPDRRGLIHEKDAQAVIRWNDMMEAIFAEDLACQAVVTASGETCPGCAPENLTDTREDTCYAPREKLGEVVLTFPEEITFDCFRLEETIELGHRVRGFSLDIRTETGWQEVYHGECIGFCWAERLRPMVTRAVRLRITQADVPPVLRRLRLYNTRGIGLKKTETLAPAEYTGLTIHREENALVVNLGGIYPYDQVIFSGQGDYQIFAFNGTTYAPVWQGSQSPATFPVVTGSYQLKLVAREGTLPEGDTIRVCLQPAAGEAAK